MKTISGRNNGTLKKLEPGDRLPGGGHPGGQNFKTVASRYLTGVMREENPLTGKIQRLSGMEILFLTLLKKALSGDVTAAREILDRIEGRPIQSVHTSYEQIIQEERDILTLFPFAAPADSNKKPE